MKTIEEYWSDDQDENKATNTQLKVESLELQARQVVMECRHAVSVAENERDAYIIALKNSEKPSFQNIINHAKNVDAKTAELEAASNTYALCYNKPNV